MCIARVTINKFHSGFSQGEPEHAAGTNNTQISVAWGNQSLFLCHSTWTWDVTGGDTTWNITGHRGLTGKCGKLLTGSQSPLERLCQGDIDDFGSNSIGQVNHMRMPDSEGRKAQSHRELKRRMRSIDKEHTHHILYPSDHQIFAYCPSHTKYFHLQI